MKIYIGFAIDMDGAYNNKINSTGQIIPENHKDYNNFHLLSHNYYHKKLKNHLKLLKTKLKNNQLERKNIRKILY